MKLYTKAVLNALLILGCVITQATHAQTPQPAGVIFENVRIFNGTSDQLTAPSNVLVVGNTIKAISNAPIAVPPETSVIRIQGGGRTLMPGLIDPCAYLHERQLPS
jgi:imidazolonepropionase-like amidohydrolase